MTLKFILYSLRKPGIAIDLDCADGVAQGPTRDAGKAATISHGRRNARGLYVQSAQGIKGDHAGSEASCGVITSRSL